VIAVAATVAVAVAAGTWARTRWDGAERLARGILAALIYTVVPFVAFFNIARLEITVDVGGGILLAHVVLVLTGTAAWLAGRRALKLSRPDAGALVNASILANTGYLGLPLTVALLGSDRLGEAVVYDTVVGAPSLLLGAFGVAAAAGERAGEGVRERTRTFLVRNPPLVAVLAALAAPDSLAPDALLDASRVIVLAILPLGFFAAGVILAGEREVRSRPVPALSAPVATALGLRLLVAPALLAGLAAPLIDLPEPYLLLAAMPCGINALAVAHVYGLNVRLTAAAIAWGTAIVLAAALLARAVA